MNLLLFDIDGTLILSGGAGFRAMTQAFADLYGPTDAFDGVELAGRTDTSIFQDALKKYDIPDDDGRLELFKSRYFELLPHEIGKTEGNKRIMPGVEPLLQRLVQLPNVALGLLTGNWEVSGRIKLGHFALAKYFSFGAFADDSAIRADLLPFAVARYEKQTGRCVQPEQVFVVGDTPADILCAKPHGAVSVAVAAAHYSADQLREHQPDYLFDDLQDASRFLAILR
ncbi:HAD hydrolase-like protein [candidate division KSB1 bacterium]|nr:HAD hydrolase-like protein [candidate division KSB1 bacterium]